MKLWIPKAKILESKSEFLLPSRVSGRYKLQVSGPLGVRRETPWFDNLILDGGLERLGTSPTTHSRCVVGTGTTAPVVGDTQLGAQVASTTSLAVVLTTLATTPYGARKTFTYQFGEGVAQGNLTEVGVGWGDTTLFSRALIENSGGSPTTLSVQADEFLTVTYELTVFPPLGDVLNTIDIGGVSYDTVLRASQVNSTAGWRLQPTISTDTFVGGLGAGAASHRVYDGTIGTIESLPTGTSSIATGVTASSYGPTNLYRDFAVEWGLANGNVGGIASHAGDFSQDGSGARMRFQASYVPDIPKDNTMVLNLNFRHSWARA